MWLIDIVYGLVLLILDWCIPADHPMKAVYFIAFVVLFCTSQILIKIGGRK